MQTDFRKYPSPAYGDVQKEETEWKLKEKSLTQEKWKRLFPDGINVFCPFDGISATRVALDRLGIPVNNYYSSEIDKPAIAIAQKNYPDTIQLGDVCDISGSDLPKIDLMVGGSPCQGFSFAGDQLAFDDPRSALFFEFERLLHEIKPTYFLLENVKMKKEFQDIISSRLNCEPIEINSALVSPQSRRRLYWTNINGVHQPKDLHLYLKHILETSAGKEYNVSQRLNDGYKGGDQLNPNYKSQGNTIHRQKVATLCAGTHGYAHGYVERPCELRDFNPKSECHHVATASDINGHDILKRVYADSGKSPTLNAHGGGNTEPKVLIVREKVKVRKHEVDIENLQQLLRVYKSSSKKTNKEIAEELDIPVTKVEHWFRTDSSFSIPSDDLWFELKNILGIKTDAFDKSITEFEIRDGKFDMADRVYNPEYKSPTVVASNVSKVLVDRNIPDEVVHAEVKKLLKDSKYENNFKWKWDSDGRILVMRPDGLKIQRIGRIAFPDNKSEIVTGVSQPHTTYRKLTPKECERLQTFPDDYTDGISKTQRYKCLGNSFTVDVIAHILSSMDGTFAKQPEQLEINI